MYENFPSKDTVSFEDFKKALFTFNTLLVKSLVETGNTYILPSRGGTLSIRKRKGTKKKDFNPHLSSPEKNYYYQNLHTDGYYARYHWDKTHPRLDLPHPYARMVKFKPCQSARKYLSDGIIERDLMRKYYDHDN